MLFRRLGSGAVRAGAGARVGASRALSLGPKLKHDEARATSLRDVLDRSADVFFLTEIFRALWLMTEVAMRPKVTHCLTYCLTHCLTVALSHLWDFCLAASPR
jgi:hypothetical protein